MTVSFLKCKKFFQDVFFFCFLELRMFPPEILNLRPRKFHFPKYKKNFFLRKYKKVFNLEPKSSISGNKRKTYLEKI